MVSDIYLLLGVDEDASWEEIKSAYYKLMGAISACDQGNWDTELRQRFVQARQQLAATLDEPGTKRSHEEFQQSKNDQCPPSFCRPKLGQLLVAARLLSMEELDAALEIQSNTKNDHVPLGELLVATGHLTEQQIDYYLRIQKLFELPIDHPERWGNKLIQLGLITEDQLKVALIEQKQTQCTLREALMNRGWLNAEVLDRIF